MLLFIARSIAFVAMFTCGVFYSVLGAVASLWIGFGFLLGMMLLDLSFEVSGYYRRQAIDAKRSGDVCFTVLLIVAFYGILLLIMFAAALVATNRAPDKSGKSTPRIAIDVVIGSQQGQTPVTQ